MSDTPWNAAALARRRWIMERLTERKGTGLGTPTIRALATGAATVPSVIHGDLMALERLGYIRFGAPYSIGTIRVLVPFLSGHIEQVQRSDDAA